MQETHPPRRSTGIPPARPGVLVAVAALALAAWGGAAQANNLVQNGSFSLTSGVDSGSSAQFGTGYLNGSVPYLTVTDWTTSGYNFLFIPQTGTTSGTSADNAGAVGSAGALTLWGPGTGSSNGLTLSPDVRSRHADHRRPDPRRHSDADVRMGRHAAVWLQWRHDRLLAGQSRHPDPVHPNL
jgi:hypothetical protein